MHLWELLGFVGIAFLILEMFTPSMFFLNFALAAFITAVVSVYTKNPYALTINKYIGQIAKAEEDITEFSGVVTIYGERWDARSENKTVIPKDSEVKIVRNESIIMYVVEK